MALEKYFPFRSVSGDRKYSAEDWAAYFAQFIRDGVFYSSARKLKVEASEGMKVAVQTGAGFVAGRMYILEEEKILALDIADGVLNRIDRIVLCCDYVNRKISIEVKKGRYGEMPTAPELTRDADVYELALADVYVAAGAVAISEANITDQRLNNSLCGIVTGLVDQADTKEIFNQFQAYLQEFKEMSQADFEYWFKNVKAVLDEDATGNLLTKINAKADKTELDAERARIDKILALPEGGTVEEAALNDIAVAADGTVYETPGAAVRAQVTNLKSDLGELNEDVLGKVTLVSSASEFTNATSYTKDGVIATLDRRPSTELIDCTKFASIKYKLWALYDANNKMNFINFFDSDGNYLSGLYNTSSGVVTGEVNVPSGASYLTGTWYTGETERPYIIGQVDENLNSRMEKLEVATEQKLYIGKGKNLYNPELSVNERILYDVVGNVQKTATSDTQMLQKIVIDPSLTYAVSNISAYSLADSNNIITVSRIAVGYGSSAIITDIPKDSYYMYIESNVTMNDTLSQIEIGDKVTAYEHYTEQATIEVNGNPIVSLKDIPTITGMYLDGVVNPQMTKLEFVNAFNSAMEDYAELNSCYIESFDTIPTWSNINDEKSWDFIYEIVNHNLREDVATFDKSFEKVCSDINKALTQKIYRFCDAKLNDGTARDFSLNTNFQSEEPSVIVSEDGNTLHIYGKLRRISTTDGVNWTEPINTPLSDGGYIMHNNVNLIDGVYYMIGCRSNFGGALVLYTSTDGINFTLKGNLFNEGAEFTTGIPIDNWGNTYLVKDYGSGKFYLYVETTLNDDSWEINLATCTDIFAENADGTIGNWEMCSNNPVLAKPYKEYSNAVSTAGNPDFARGSDNRPIKVDGKYYMFFHSTYKAISHILRAYSTDLINWTNEGCLFDNRDMPSAGDNTSGNADASIIEFKGRTYMFYTWNINTTEYLPYIKYTVDDRPIRELLKIRP